ncbi:thiol reductant ABC exporter subunit CydD [Thalassobaculum sp.]
MVDVVPPSVAGSGEAPPLSVLRAQERRRRRWLTDRARAVRLPLALAVAAGFAAGLLAVAQAWVLARLIADAVAGDAVDRLLPAAGLAVLVFAARAGLTVAAEVLATTAASRVKRALRAELVAALGRLGPSWLKTRRSGAVAATVIEQVETLDGFVARYLPVQALAAAVPVALLVPAFMVDAGAGWILLAAGALVPVAMALVGMRTAVAARRQMTGLQRMSGVFLDRLQGLTTLKLFGAAERELDRIREVADGYRGATMAVLRLAFLSSTVLELLAVGSLALVAGRVASSALGGGGVSLQAALFLLILVPEMFQPLRRLGQHYHDRAAALGATEGMLEILDAVAALPADGAAWRLAEAPAIAFDRVGLAYPGGRRPALDGASFRVAAGETVALVGESGAGKSSILAILLGSERPTSGTVTVDGRLLDGPALRASIAWAGQNPRIVAGTLADNLRLGHPDAPDDAVRAAAETCRVGDFADRLPQGLATVVGEGGRGLSGGEARRVALARALLRDAPLVLLDEPTANLDGDSEAAVLDAIDRIRAGRTVLIATHSEAVIRRADRVLRVESGRVLALPEGAAVD